ncbi:class I SAM-dependent methyltransferase [Prauserella cavernicola]|uniref:Methyltransferase domain-containing protein n=1 Tax=Prauserella cavernicola TaxID=2800127 RepID=A0A934QZV1_9PSEU|nr:class I SAM-dependent methyltransferase [Prauserella cavernicola]MBK1789107.1 methyltransferase domain-containing protein [Prauserella cavernicola]
MSAEADRLRWNERYAAAPPDFTPHRLVAEAERAGIPDGAVLDLACGRSGSALALAAGGRAVTAVDISDVALSQLGAEARRRGLAVRLVEADAPAFAAADEGSYALVLATRYWDTAAFTSAAGLVAEGGLLAWEALAAAAGEPPRPFRVRPGELRARLPAGFDVLTDVTDQQSSRILARRARVPA